MRVHVPTELHRPLAAEALGTGLLVAALVASGIMAEHLADGNAALALLGNALATVSVLAVLTAVLEPVSGAHLNPVITLVAVLRGELARMAGAAYAAVQTLGAIVGVWVAHAMSSQELLQMSTQSRASGGALIAEAIATFGFVLTVLACRSTNRSALVWAVPAFIAGAFWFTASATLANPAAIIARAFTDSFSGIAPIDVPGFVIAEIAGALLAGVFARWLFVPRRSGEVS
jgi:glycerol uptake facilitator-like aquaporin